MEPVVIQFNKRKGELSIRIGNETLIIDDFVVDMSGDIEQAILPVYAQEKIIKKLVANIKLT